MPVAETNPKVFISYCWTTPDHEESVRRLAEDLRKNGVDAILDKWDLKEGHDGNKFMELMVNDADIRKVAIICDKGYVIKANERDGGVGIETQIITSEIYGRQSQDKFVAIVFERNQDGTPCLPTFYRSRKFIDFTDPSKQSESFEQLLRWIFDKPVFKKPPLGNVPTFLKDDNSAITLATSSQFQRAVSATRNNHDNKFVLLEEFLEVLSAELEKLRIKCETVGTFDKLVVRSLESFLPYRNQVLQLFLLLARYPDTIESGKVIYRFLQKLIPYMGPTANFPSYQELDFDNFKFIVHELYLYTVACFIYYERFETAAYLISQPFYVPSDSRGYGARMESFSVFYNNLRSLEHRNERLNMNLRKFALHAELLKERSAQSGVEFQHLMQADFVLYLRSLLNGDENPYYSWLPVTLVYTCDYPSTFQIFARSQSREYFNEVKILLGITDKNDLGSLLVKLQKNPQILPRWSYQAISPIQLLGFDQLATTP